MSVVVTVRRKEFEEPKPWQLLRRARIYGDPIVALEANMDIKKQFPEEQWGWQGNFQNMDCGVLYDNGHLEFGGVHQWLGISNADFRYIERFNPPDGMGTTRQKMEWLSANYRGSILMWYDKDQNPFDGYPAQWGTIVLGGNLVWVERVERMKNVATYDGAVRDREMAVLRGFTPADWGRPRQELVEQGLLHRCHTAHGMNNLFSEDTPRGAVYCPFFHPHGSRFQTGWRLHGWRRLDAFRVPVEWLENG